MLTNYFSSGSFFGSIVFVVGVWFGILRAHAIFQYKSSLLVLITLSTLGFPVLTHLLVTEGGYTALAGLQAKYAALVGFLVPTIFAEFMMMLYGPSTGQREPVSRVRPPAARKPSPPVAPAIQAEAPRPSPVVVQARMIEEPLPVAPPPAKPKHSPDPAHKPAPVTVQARMIEEPLPVAPPPAKPKVRSAPAPASAAARKPAPVAVQVDLLEEDLLELPVVQITPVKASPTRKSAPASAPAAARVQTAKPQESSGENAVQYGSLRLFIYFFIFLIVVLFPPFHETVSNSRAWLFITQVNTKPFFAFDLMFLVYELVVLAAVTAVYEFYRSQTYE